MAVTRIPVVNSPFQGGPASPNEAKGIYLDATYSFGSSGAAIAATEEMEFVNDGYTMLFVTTGTTGVTLTVDSVEDNAGRTQDCVKICQPSKTVALGPFRPIWWNYGGVTNLSFAGSTGTSIAGAQVAAVRFQV